MLPRLALIRRYTPWSSLLARYVFKPATLLITDFDCESPPGQLRPVGHTTFTYLRCSPCARAPNSPLLAPMSPVSTLFGRPSSLRTPNITPTFQQHFLNTRNDDGYVPRPMPQGKISSLREQIHSLDTQMAELMYQRQSLEAQLEQAVRLQSPVIRLPSELLSSIFIMGVLGMGDEDPIMVPTLMLVWYVNRSNKHLTRMLIRLQPLLGRSGAEYTSAMGKDHRRPP